MFESLEGKLDLMNNEICRMDLPIEDAHDMPAIIEKLLPYCVDAGKINATDLIRCYVMVATSLFSDLKQFNELGFDKFMSVDKEIQTAVAVLSARLNHMLTELQKAQ
jgi:hypothetical protein